MSEVIEPAPGIQNGPELTTRPPKPEIVEVKSGNEKQIDALELVKEETSANPAMISHTANFFTREYESVRMAFNLKKEEREAVVKVHEHTKGNPNRERALEHLFAADDAGALRLVRSFDDPTEELIDRDKAHADLVQAVLGERSDEEKFKRIAISRWAIFAKLTHKWMEAHNKGGDS